MTPIDIQLSRSKVKVKGHAFPLYVWEGGISFYKHLYLKKKLRRCCSNEKGVQSG